MNASSGLSKKLLVVAGVLTLSVAAAIAYSVFFGEKSPEANETPGEPLARALVTYYTKCGCFVVEKGEPGETGALPSSDGADGWQQTGGAKGAAFFFRTVDDYCPEHARTRFVTLKDGVVAVYRGHTADDRFLIQTFSDLKEELMTSETREDLSSGLLIEDEPDRVDELVDLLLEGIID